MKAIKNTIGFELAAIAINLMVGVVAVTGMVL